MLLVAAKMDVVNPDKLKKLQSMAKRRKLALVEISAVTGAGVEPLRYAIGERVRQLRAEMSAAQ